MDTRKTTRKINDAVYYLVIELLGSPLYKSESIARS